MKININFEINKQQYQELLDALGYSKKIIDVKTGKEIDNPRTDKEIFTYALREHVGAFIQMFSKQRIHTKLRKEEDEVNEKEVQPVVDKMGIEIK